MAHRKETYRLFVLMAHHEETLAFGPHGSREETHQLFVLMAHREKTLAFDPHGSL